MGNKIEQELPNKKIISIESMNTLNEGLESVEYIYLKPSDFLKLKESHSILEELSNLPETMTLYIKKANIFKRNKEYLKSIKFYEMALVKMEDLKHPKLLDTYKNLGDCYKSLSDYEKSILNYLKFINLRKEKFGEHDIELISTYVQLGRVYFKNGDPSKAIALFNKSGKILDKFIDKNEITSKIYWNLAFGYYRAGKICRAIKYYEISYRITEYSKSSYYQDLIKVINKINSN
jgi:tetratricopeptide (TPR) repeat protein